MRVEFCEKITAVKGGSVYNCTSLLGCSAWLDQILLSLRDHVRSDDFSKVKSNGWKSCVKVTCKGRSVYEERPKSIELSRAWSFYLSSSKSLSGAIRPSDHCVLQPPNIYLNPQIVYFNLSLDSQRPTGLVTDIILMHSYHPDTPHDSRRVPLEVFASDQGQV